MKITHVVIASAALAFGSAALAQEEVQGSTGLCSAAGAVRPGCRRGVG